MLRGKVLAEACFSTTSPGVTASLCPRGVAFSTAPGAGRNCPVSLIGCEHGTHVASIAAGRSDIAADAGIVAVRVFSRVHDREFCGRRGGDVCLGAFLSDVVRVLERVHALRGRLRIAAVNLSLGGGLFPSVCDRASPAMTAVISRLRRAGIATAVAAGNDAQVGAVAFLACVSAAVAVAATAAQHFPPPDDLADFSNFGWLVDLMAPGSEIGSAFPGRVYRSRSGTSAAAPRVAGGFAVLRQAYPVATVDEIVAAMGQGPVRIRREGLSYSRARLDLAAAREALGGVATPSAAPWR